MIKKAVHILIVSCLSVLLLFGTTAKEYIHLFTHHEDTVHDPHHVCPPGEAHFEEQHHHCSFLSFVLEPYANDAFVPRILLIAFPYFPVQQSVVAAKFTPFPFLQITLRGPPALAA